MEKTFVKLFHKYIVNIVVQWTNKETLLHRIFGLIYNTSIYKLHYRQFFSYMIRCRWMARTSSKKLRFCRNEGSQYCWRNYESNYDEIRWLRTPNIVLSVETRCIFIQVKDGKNFSASCNIPSNMHIDFDPYPNGPVTAKVRLGTYKYFAAKSFREYVPHHHYDIHQNTMPPIITIT